MTVKVLRAHQQAMSAKGWESCSASLEMGHVLAVPTETVYGLAVHAFHYEGIKKIYECKGRDYTKPLPIMVASTRSLGFVAKEILPEAYKLIDAFWPGPLTLIFKTHPLVLNATRGKDTVAVRIPSHPIMSKLLATVNFPLAVTSANRSGKAPLTSASKVKAEFQNEVPLLIDGGRCEVGLASTIVDVSHYPFSIIREGAIPRKKLKAVMSID